MHQRIAKLDIWVLKNPEIHCCTQSKELMCNSSLKISTPIHKLVCNHLLFEKIKKKKERSAAIIN